MLRRTPLFKRRGYTLKKIVKDIQKHKLIYAMAIPVLLYYLIFFYLPMGGIVMAFQNFRPSLGISGSDWVGLKHFFDFFQDRNFWTLMRNTFKMSFYDIIIGFPAPIIIALLLNELKSKFFKSGIQTAIYMPNFIAMVVLCGMIVDFCATEGVVNSVLATFGIEPKNLLMDSKMFLPIYLITNVWQYAGWNSIIYMAAITGINTELYDAAYVDGCGRFKRLWHVTLPGLLPTIVIMLVLRFGSIMTVGFEKILLIYNPLTYETADVISTYVYRLGLHGGNYSYATAVGLFNSVINFVFLWGANKLSRKVSDQSLW